jgi:hypothetical protein
LGDLLFVELTLFLPKLEIEVEKHLISKGGQIAQVCSVFI